jgi:hypothetical protein
MIKQKPFIVPFYMMGTELNMILRHTHVHNLIDPPNNLMKYALLLSVLLMRMLRLEDIKKLAQTGGSRM